MASWSIRFDAHSSPEGMSTIKRLEMRTDAVSSPVLGIPVPEPMQPVAG